MGKNRPPRKHAGSSAPWQAEQREEHHARIPYGKSCRQDRGPGGHKLMDEDKWRRQQAENDAAAAEGRTLYVRGLPPNWSKEKLEEFFGHQGQVTASHLLPPKPGQPGRAAFVNFAAAADTLSAAQVCDRLKIDDDGESFTLTCSIKEGLGKRVSRVSGFSDLSRAKQEKRACYFSGFPVNFDEATVRQLLGPHGSVRGIHMLPSKGRNISLFAIMSCKEDVEKLIVAFDGQDVHGHKMLVSFPRPPKRSHGLDGSAVEIRGHPDEATALDLQSLLETHGHEVHTVKIMRHESLNENLAVAYLSSHEDAVALCDTMDNFEFMPGFVLSLRVKPDNENELAPPQGSRTLYDAKRPRMSAEAPQRQQKGGWDMEPGAIEERPWQPPLPAGPERVRLRGRLMGVLAADGPLAWQRL